MDDQNLVLEQPDEGSQIDDAFERVVDFRSVIEPSQWQKPDTYYRTMHQRTRSVVRDVVANDEHLRKQLRAEVFPELMQTVPGMVWEKANPDYIELIKERHLFRGAVAAADGTLAKYETLSMVGAQIAVSHVNYQGNTSQIVANLAYWGQEIPQNPSIRDIVEGIRERGRKPKKKLSNLFLHAVMTYKEREILLGLPPDVFKIIHGTMFPHEMLTGVGQSHMLEECLGLIGRLIDDGNYATVVSNPANRDLRLLGYGLDAGEYLILGNGTDLLNEFRASANFTNVPRPEYDGRSQYEVFDTFRDRYGDQVVQGVFRAHWLSAPYVFFCNRENMHRAVHTILADASNTGPRGFPLLIDMADQHCSGAFRASEYTNYMNAEFSHAADGKMVYQSERSTRD